jgi:hypothetical protein
MIGRQIAQVLTATQLEAADACMQGKSNTQNLEQTN